MIVGRYTASRVTSCHIDVWKLSPVLKMCPRYEEMSAPPVCSNTFFAISSAYLVTEHSMSVIIFGISSWNGSSASSASAPDVPPSFFMAGFRAVLSSSDLFKRSCQFVEGIGLLTNEASSFLDTPRSCSRPSLDGQTGCLPSRLTPHDPCRQCIR